jgi:hypothetical protein
MFDYAEVLGSDKQASLLHCCIHYYGKKHFKTCPMEQHVVDTNEGKKLS